MLNVTSVPPNRDKYCSKKGKSLWFETELADKVNMKISFIDLRANVGKYRESQISSKSSNFGYHPNNPLGELFQEMILRNPQALYILRNLEKFKNSIKIQFFIREIAANFNNFQESITSAQKLLFA